MKGNALLKAYAGATVLILSAVGVASAEEAGESHSNLFCTVNASMECVFSDGAKWSGCKNVAENDVILGWIASSACKTYHDPA